MQGEGGGGAASRVLRVATSVLLCVGCLVAGVALTQEPPQVLVARPNVWWSSASLADVSIPGGGSGDDGSSDISLRREMRATSKTIAQARAEEKGETVEAGTGQSGQGSQPAGVMGSLDRKLGKILGAERTAAGAIDMLWKETNKMSSARSEESRRTEGPRLGRQASWSQQMGRDLQRLNELELPEAEQIAPGNLELKRGTGQDGRAAGAVQAPLPTQNRQHKLPSAAQATSTAIHAAATARESEEENIRQSARRRVERALRSIKIQKGGTEQLASKPRASFFQDAVRNLAARKPVARSHLKARTMMLAEEAAPQDGGEGEEAADTTMAIEDAMEDEGMGKEAALGDTLEGHWHAPMWPNGDDEGSPVLTGTIAAPGQGGEFAYGFPYDEAKLFSLASAGGGNASSANATEDAEDGEANGDVVEAAADEAEDEEGKTSGGGAAAPFYQGVGAGGALGPASQGGWNGNSLPPAMPGDAEREAWLKQRGNGFSDEFSDAARSITVLKRDGAMQRENAAAERADGQSLQLQAPTVDPRIARQREKIAQFVSAFAKAGLAAPKKDAARARLASKRIKTQVLAAEAPAKQMLLATEDAAPPGPDAAAPGAGQSLAAGAESDKEFLSKFATKRTVDHGEDFPCGWPGPPCANPGGETSGGFLGGGNARDGAFWGFRGMEAKGSVKSAELGLAKGGEPQSRYAQLASSLLAPLHFQGRSEKGDADEEKPVLR